MESFTLTKDKRVSKLISKKHLTVRDKGIFVIMEAPDLGLVVQWDKGYYTDTKIIDLLNSSFE